MSGPVPKERRLAQRGKASPQRDVAERGQAMPVPKANPEWLPYTKAWFNSLSASGQSSFYEPSDWATAVVAADVLDRCLADEATKAALWETWCSIAVRLLTTEGDRRRARVELLKRGLVDEDEESAVVSIAQWHRRLSAGPDKPA